ncbi:hypothetical protein ACQ5SO_04655 [Rhodovulum sp. DZ06]|uniref:hypothetical protein n=1 Tax=Rhodovulum sp. DZ06 TaxID=3425126 RepID=UPI003D330732
MADFQRYGAVNRRAHACFACRTSWKRPATGRERCPRCRAPLADMGAAFKAPRRRDRAQWDKVRALWLAGFRFEANRGPLPATKAELPEALAGARMHPANLFRDRLRVVPGKLRRAKTGARRLRWPEHVVLVEPRR